MVAKGKPRIIALEEHLRDAAQVADDNELVH